jgi:geranylgeranylglycerol-phosphate geranylgeranyltransferase
MLKTNLFKVVYDSIDSMRFLSAFIRLTRFEHAIMLAIAVFIGESIALGRIPDLSTAIILSLFVPIFSEMGSFALNDYVDKESDKLNKKFDRPLVSGDISPSFAFYFSWFALALSVLLSYLINIYAFAVVLIFNLLAIAYNYKLKDLPLVGNAYIALTMAIPFIFGSVVVKNSLDVSITISILAVLGFLSGFAREIIKSIQDMEGDKKARKSNTLPIIIGVKNAFYLAVFLYLLFIPLTILPFFYDLKMNIASVILIGLADIGFLFIIFVLAKKMTRSTLKMARDISLLCLFIGLLAYLIAALT